MRSQAAVSRGLARKADRLAAAADVGAGVLARQADRWAPAVEMWGDEKCKCDVDDSRIMTAARADLLEDSRQESAVSAREAERLAESERQAAEMLRTIREAAEQSAAEAARAEAGPETAEAAEALKSATAAVERASARGGRGG